MTKKTISPHFTAADQLIDGIYDKTTVILARYSPKTANQMVPSDTLTGTLQIPSSQFPNIATQINLEFGLSFDRGDVGACSTIWDLVNSISTALLGIRSTELKTRREAMPFSTSKRGNTRVTQRAEKKPSQPKRTTKRTARRNVPPKNKNR